MDDCAEIFGQCRMLTAAIPVAGSIYAFVRYSARMVRAAALAVAFGVIAVGVSASTVNAKTGSRLVASPLVGQWQRVTKCRELVADLKRAGLGATVAQAWVGQTSSTGQSSFKAGSPKPTRAHPCTGAIPRLHSHFFTASGMFGSLDWLGGQVDDGAYQVANPTTVKINKVPFHFTIKNGNILSLSPMLTKAMIRKAVAHPARFSPAFWAVTVAYAGHSWKRVPCSKCG